jgi:hypothetical protein
MIDAITKQFAQLGYVEASTIGKRDFRHAIELDEDALRQRAESIALERDYPRDLANRNVSRPI